MTFRDTVETFPVSGRMDRLRRLLYEEAEEQRKRHTKAMRKTYRDQLREIQQEKEKEKTSQQKRKLPVSHKSCSVTWRLYTPGSLVTSMLAGGSGCHDPFLQILEKIFFFSRKVQSLPYFSYLLEAR